MAKINIRESLGKRDLASDNKYDLRNTYDSLNLSESKKKQLARALYENKSNRIIYSILNESSINTEHKLEDIDFMMSYEMPVYFRVSDAEEPGCYIVSYDEYTEVEVKFDLAAPGYVFTIDGNGPFEHSSFEYIPSDISRELDRKIASKHNYFGESLNRHQLRESAYIEQFSRYSDEYEKLDRVATFLTAMSPNKYYYYVGNTYFDFGQDWKWTTILAKTPRGDSYQALNPRQQEDILLATSDEELEEIAKLILKNSYSDKGFIYESRSIKEDFDDNDFDEDVVEEGNRFFADGKDYTWDERIAGPVHLDFDNWSVWSAVESVNILDYATEKPEGGYDVDRDAFMKAYMESPVKYFVVDEDTGFIDWGPCDTDIEAKDFLNSKKDDWENDEL